MAEQRDLVAEHDACGVSWVELPLESPCVTKCTGLGQVGLAGWVRSRVFLLRLHVLYYLTQVMLQHLWNAMRREAVDLVENDQPVVHT